MRYNTGSFAGAVLATMCVSGVCQAQYVGEATFAWEASTDGTNWVKDLLEVPASRQDVFVRAHIDWEVPDGTGFFYTRFDATVSSAEGVGTADEALEPTRPPPWNGNPQTVVASRFGSVVKIDSVRDTSPPGEGLYSVLCGQPLSFEMNRETAIDIFTFRLRLDGTAGERVVSQRFLSPGPYGNTTDRVVIVYRWHDSLQVYPLTTCRDLVIRVLCLADFNRDAQVDFFDYLDFTQAFSDDDPTADFNQDEQVDFFDYLDFVQAFSDGC